MACDVEQLLQDGRDYQDLSQKQRALVRLQMLCQISDAEQAVASVVFGGTGSPEGLVDVVGPAIYIDATGKLYSKPALDGGSTGWVLVGP